MRLGLYGGCFVPPHRAHLRVAEAARDAFRLDRVLLAPVGRQPLKAVGAVASYADRLAMTSLVCELDLTGTLQASDVDAPQASSEPNYTVDTLDRLRAGSFAKDELFVITGADAFLDLRSWREPERLLQLAEWVVVSRPGASETELDRLGLNTDQRGRVHWLDGVLDPVSATAVRARLAAGEDCRSLVPEPVLRYIRMHGLYREAKD